MPRTLFLIVCLLILQAINSFSQISESAVIPYTKNRDLKPLGGSNGHVYFYATELHKEIFRITVYKFKEENLELVESKDIVVKDFKPQAFYNYPTGTCKIEAIYKNNKFYFFYSLLRERSYYIYLKTLDENFSNEKNAELGSIIETGNDNLGNFFVYYSPDFKTVLLSLKNYSERTKTFGHNTEIFEGTELVCYDLVNDKIKYTKKLPIDVDGLRLKTEQYKVDNDGNVMFISFLAERKDKNYIVRSMSLGYTNNVQDQITFKKIDISEISSFNSKLWQLKNNDLVLTTVSGNKIDMKYISFANPSRNYETKIDPSYFNNYKKEYHIANLVESDAGFFLFFRENSKLNMYGWRIWPPDEEYPLLFVSNKGTLEWSKKIALLKPLYFNARDISAVNSVFYNHKLHLFYMENKKYDESNEKFQKYLANNYQIQEDGFKNFHTMELVVGEDQSEGKIVVNEDEKLFLNPTDENFLSIDGKMYFVVTSAKTFKIKKVILN